MAILPNSQRVHQYEDLLVHQLLQLSDLIRSVEIRGWKHGGGVLGEVQGIFQLEKTSVEGDDVAQRWGSGHGLSPNSNL